MHIGIIPDGNRRWAKKTHTALSDTYAIGFRNVIDITLFLAASGFQEITFYGLTEDNYQKRPKDQIETVLSYVIEEMNHQILLMVMNGIRVRFYGNLKNLKHQHQDNLGEIIQKTSALPNFQSNLNILLNYSPRWDFSTSHANINTSEIPPCDLIYRSGCAKRLSGFLPLQASFAELYFSSRLWPEVRPADFVAITKKFGKVKRNFGA